MVILDHLYSCRFGTFLYNCENARDINVSLTHTHTHTHGLDDSLNSALLSEQVAFLNRANQCLPDNNGMGAFLPV